MAEPLTENELKSWLITLSTLHPTQTHPVSGHWLERILDTIADLQRQLQQAREDLKCEQDAHRAHLNTLERVKAERDAAIRRLADYEDASSVLLLLADRDAAIERAEAAEALLREVAGAIQYDGKTLTIYGNLPDVLQHILAETQERQEDSG